MKKPLRGAFIALAIITSAVFAMWAAVFAVNLIQCIVGGANVMDAILAPFDFGEVNRLISNIISYVVAAAALALLVVSITAIKKRPGAKAFAIILSVLGIILGIYSFSFLFSSGADFQCGVVPFFGVMTTMFGGDAMLNAILVLAAYALAVIYLVMLIITVVIAVQYSKKYIQAKAEKRAAEIAEEEAAVREYEAASAPQLEEEVVVAAASEEIAAEATYDTIGAEPIPVFVPEPEPTVEEEPIEEKKEEPKEEPITAKSLADMIRDVVREIVKDELAKQPKDERPENDNHSVVGATFGGPLVVQYFNGGINGVTPAQPNVVPAPAPAEEVKEEPKVEEPAPVEEVVEEPVVEEVVEKAPVAEVVEEVPVAEPVVEVPTPIEEVAPKAPIIRIPFEERITKAEKEMQENYNIIKNEILSYGVKSRVSSSGDTFRLHCKTYVKLTVAGKSLKLYFALDPKDYADSKMPIADAGEKNIYQEIPLVFKVKSGLSLRRCKDLIRDVMEKDGLEQGEVESVNWVKELKAEMKERAKAEKAAAKEAEDSEEE